MRRLERLSLTNDGSDVLILLRLVTVWSDCNGHNSIGQHRSALVHPVQLIAVKWSNSNRVNVLGSFQSVALLQNNFSNMAPITRCLASQGSVKLQMGL